MKISRFQRKPSARNLASVRRWQLWVGSPDDSRHVSSFLLSNIVIIIAMTINRPLGCLQTFCRFGILLQMIWSGTLATRPQSMIRYFIFCVFNIFVLFYWSVKKYELWKIYDKANICWKEEFLWEALRQGREEWSRLFLICWKPRWAVRSQLRQTALQWWRREHSSDNCDNDIADPTGKEPSHKQPAARITSANLLLGHISIAPKLDFLHFCHFCFWRFLISIDIRQLSDIIWW